MRKKEMEARIQTAFARETPDQLHQILSSCDEQRGCVISMAEEKKKRSKVWVGVVAAVLAVLMINGVFLTTYFHSTTAASVISLDVNPSIQLTVSGNKTILEAKAVNEDANAILQNLNLEGKKLDGALHELVCSFMDHGYLERLSSALLVSVEDSKGGRAKRLQTYLDAELNKIFFQTSSGASLVTQVVSSDKELKEKAEQNRISEGRAKLIADIQALNPALKFDDLAKLTVEELHQLLQAGAKGLPIGKDAALQSALNHANLTKEQVLDTDVDAELTEIPSHYDVELLTEKGEFEYHVDAFTGRVIRGLEDAEDALDQGKIPAAPSEKDSIGKEKAVEIALKHANLKQNAVRGLHCKLDYDDNQWVYEVEFRTDAMEYEYHLLPANGLILESEQDRVEPEDADDDEDTDTDEEDDEDEENEEGDKAPAKISEEQALKAAAKHAGVQESQLAGKETERDGEVYEVSFRSGHIFYEYEVDVQTGGIRKHTQKTMSETGTLLTEDKAKELAAKRAGVAVQAMENVTCSFDVDNGIGCYSVEFEANSMEYEVELHVITGAVLDFEAEPID